MVYKPSPKMKIAHNIILFAAASALFACSGAPKSVEAEVSGTLSEGQLGRAVALPHVRIYRTRADYANLVPITLDGTHTRVVAYPTPTDLNETQKPVPLGNGWYWDRRGISAGTAFTDFTYEQYAALPEAPSHAELLRHVKDRFPLVELWDCGTQARTTDELKALIKNGFPGCKKYSLDGF